jgi:hypothetical protein
MVSHHLMAWLLYQHGSPAFYRKVLAKWYGPLIAEWSWNELLQGRPVWESRMVSEVPFFEEVVQHATGCVTHSSYAARKVSTVFGGMKVKVVPQLYLGAAPRPPKIGQTFRIGVFGGVDPN